MTKLIHFDIIVIGGGHAGTEAAWAAAAATPPGARIALITMDTTKIGAMSCNPAIGGLAKGQIVREIDALGGIMGRAIDATGIQFRILNTSRGAAVHGPRAQADKYKYAREVQRLLATRPKIQLLETCVDQLIVDPKKNRRCTGVIVNGQPIHAEAVILTTGTFLRGLMHTGTTKTKGGRIDEGSAEGISGELHRLGFELGRLKTGTPPRLAAETINFAELEPQPGDAVPTTFSEMSPEFLPAGKFPALPQIACHTTYTNEKIHAFIRDNLDRAPLYSGALAAEAGPRYCPSIEDKVVRFADRTAHHVFLEPESLESNEVYCNGISTSLPREVQDRIIALLPACANARILTYGYAVEYDMVWPHQIYASTMTKTVPGLFLAGQINGTSGYEEAAAQGLVAGLNAARHVQSLPLIQFSRATSYLGVMLDDLVTKTPREPYRMFTSRAEFRLHLRADNAPDRLTPLAKEWGLLDQPRTERFNRRTRTLHSIHEMLNARKVNPHTTLADLPKRGDSTFDKWYHDLPSGTERRLAFVVFNNLRYESYLKRQANDNRRMAAMENRLIPAHFNFQRVQGLRNEAVEVLSKFNPQTLGQAGRLAGVNPADITLLAVALGKR